MFGSILRFLCVLSLMAFVACASSQKKEGDNSGAKHSAADQAAQDTADTMDEATESVEEDVIDALSSDDDKSADDEKAPE